MAFQVSPGINVSEVDLTAVVPAVQTTAGAYAGHFRWGPVEQVVSISSEDKLLSTFGKPNTSNTAVDFLTAASFLAYSNDLKTVRVVNQGNANTSLRARNASGVANTTNLVIKNEDDYQENYESGISGYGDWVAKFPGALGNSLKVSVCPSSSAWQSTLTGTLSITSNTATVTGSGTQFTTQLTVGDLLVIGPDREMFKVSAIANTTSLTLEETYAGNTVTSATVTRRWEFFPYFDSAPGTSPAATTAGGSADELHIAVIDEDGQWTGIADTVVEKFEKLSFASDARAEDGSALYYKDVVNKRSKYVWWAKHSTGNTGAGGAASTSFTGKTTPISVSLTGGRDGAAPANSDYITGYNKFRNSEAVDVSFIIGGAANQTVATHIINNIAEVRKDALAVVSPKRSDVVDNSGYEGKEVDAIVTYRNLLPSSTYAVLDSNWKYVYDKYNDVYRFIPCNADTAGVMVRTDNQRDPWFSPAGFQRGTFKGVVKLAYNPTKAQRDTLYKANVNPVVTFPGQGTVLYGDKTLVSNPSAFDRINVRRLFIVLEKSITAAAQSTLFEFNDALTRAQFVNLVEPFLREVQARRGIFDFRVVCDDTNNTGDVIDRNEFVGDIYVKPARSINYIQLNFVAVRTGVEFTEIVGRDLA